MAWIKFDVRNAFNTMDRKSMAQAVQIHLTALTRYYFSAYGAPTPLFFGEWRIASQTGVQQGDPLGPLLFSLGLFAARSRIEATKLEGWYLDDGIVACPPSSVETVFAEVAAQFASVGLAIREDKCEIVSAVSIAGLPLVPRTLSASLALLGSCCGDTDHRTAHANRITDLLVRKIQLFGAVARRDGHAGYQLLRLCGSFPTLNYQLRCGGSHQCWGKADDAVILALEKAM